MRKILPLALAAALLAACGGDAPAPVDAGAAPASASPRRGDGIPGMPSSPEAPSAAAAGSASPQEAYERMRVAQGTRDWRGYHASLSPEARGTLLPATAVYARMAFTREDGSDDAQALAAFRELLRRHGADAGFLEQRAPEGGPGMADREFGGFHRVADPAGLYADLMTLLDRQGVEAGFRRRGVLGPVTVEGDSATGRAQVLHDDGTTGEEDIAFRRVDGRWFVHVGP